MGLMSRPPTAEERQSVNELMDQLSQCTTTDQVASFLQELDIFGWINNTENCPVANLVKTVLPVDCRVSARYESIRFAVTNYISSPWELIDGARVPTPPIVAQFMKEFDRGMYPHLCGLE
jgi:hypothetical protein